MSNRIDLNKEPELRVLSEAYNLYLKPVARVHLTVQLPVLHDVTGKVKSVTTWEIIEKLRQFCPGVLSPPVPIRVLRTTLEFVRLIAEVDTKSDVKRVVTSLDSQFIKLSGFPQNLHVRASEAPSDCPRRHDWESFFRDAEEMDETKYGERPDTLVLDGLPVRWFTNPETASNEQPSTNVMRDRPSPEVLRVTFAAFGAIRHVDIPMLDPVQNPHSTNEYLIEYGGFTASELLLVADTPDPTKSTTRGSAPSADINTTDESHTGGFGKIGPDTISVMSGQQRPSSLSHISPHLVNKAFSLNDASDPDKSALTLSTPLTFMAFVQYKDYTGFLKAMESLRGQKLVFAPPSTVKTTSEDSVGHKVYFTADMKIDFDRTKHLSTESIDARQTERDRLTLMMRHRVEELKVVVEAKARERQLIEEANRKAEERRRAESLAKEAERAARSAARVERRKQRAIERCKRTKEALVKQKISLDERRRLLAVRKVQAFRLMNFLLSRVHDRHDAVVAERRRTRLIQAEQAASAAESLAISTTELRTSITNDTKLSDQEDPIPSAESSSSCGSPTKTAAATETPPADTDDLLQKLLKKREENLRMLLLKKRNSVPSVTSNRSLSPAENVKSLHWTRKMVRSYPR